MLPIGLNDISLNGSLDSDSQEDNSVEEIQQQDDEELLNAEVPDSTGSKSDCDSIPSEHSEGFNHHEYLRRYALRVVTITH